MIPAGDFPRNFESWAACLGLACMNFELGEPVADMSRLKNLSLKEDSA